ncbi:MAG: serine hydrolase domain-containing protein [Chloroflexota bacterium]
MKRHLILIIASINLVVLLWAYLPQQNNVDSYFLGLPIDKDVLDGFIQQEMATRNIPGLAYAVINDGEVVHQNRFGYANLADQTPISEETIFEGGSISKPMFAFFVMTFVEEGKLDLDRPLHDYFPHPDMGHDERAKHITARMVLSHRSGFPNWRENEEDGQLRLYFEPGTDYLYSGEGYQYLAMVLREIEQTDWAGLEQIFQERVAQPIGLEHTVYIQTAYTRANKAEPYDADGQRFDWENGDWFLKEDGNFFAPSSLHSEPVDFAKWMIAVMNEKLLMPASYAELLKRHSTVPSNDIELFYTLGFFTLPFPLNDVYAHSGNNVGFGSWFALEQEKDWGFVMLTNSDNGELFGEELLFYLLTGPNLTKFFAVVSVLALSAVCLLILGIGAARGYWRGRRASAG